MVAGVRPPSTAQEHRDARLGRDVAVCVIDGANPIEKGARIARRPLNHDAPTRAGFSVVVFFVVIETVEVDVVFEDKRGESILSTENDRSGQKVYAAPVSVER